MFIEEVTIKLEAGSRIIIQKSLPLKSIDPKSFTIPVTIGESLVRETLLDLGAIINQMPLSMMKRIVNLKVDLPKSHCSLLRDISSTLMG